MTKQILSDFDRLDWIDFVDIVTLAEQFFQPCVVCILIEQQDDFVPIVSDKEAYLPVYLKTFLRNALTNAETTIAYPLSDTHHNLNQNQIHFIAVEPLLNNAGMQVDLLCIYSMSNYELTNAKRGLLKIISKQIVNLAELKITQKQGKQHLIELSKRDETLRRIALMQSHEIRHPLAAIIGLINLVKDGIHQLDETWMNMMLDVTQVLDSKIKAIVNEASGEADVKHLAFNRIVEEIEDYAILLLDKYGNIENWNKGAEKMKGYLSAEIVGKHFSVFYPESEQLMELPHQLLELAAKTGVARNEGWRKRKDGTLFWARVMISAVYNETKNLVGYIKVTRDLTEMKKSESAIKQYEERFKHMVDVIEDYAIILLDENGNIERWNKGAEKIKGYTADEIIGKNFSIFYDHKSQEQKLPEQLLQKAKTDGKARHEGWRIKKDNSRFWGSIVITTIYNEIGNVIGFVKVTKDIGVNLPPH